MARQPAQTTEQAKPTPMTTADVAELLMVSPLTVRNWCDEGYLGFHRTPGGHRRFFQSDVDAFMANRYRQEEKRELSAIPTSQTSLSESTQKSAEKEHDSVASLKKGLELSRKIDLIRDGLEVNLEIMNIVGMNKGEDGNVLRLVDTLKNAKPLINSSALPNEDKDTLNSTLFDTLISLQFHDRMSQRLEAVSSKISKLNHSIQNLIDDCSEEEWTVIEEQLQSSMNSGDNARVISYVTNDHSIEKALSRLPTQSESDQDEFDDGMLF